MPITILALAPLSFATVAPLAIVLALLVALVLAYGEDRSVLMTDVEIREACGRTAMVPDAPSRAVLANVMRDVAAKVETLAVYMVETNPYALPWFVHARNTADAIEQVISDAEAEGYVIRDCPALWNIVQMGVMPPLEARIL